MLTYALIVFAIAAVGGLLLASSVLRGKLAPWALSIGHALLGATGLILLIVTVLQGSTPGRVTAALGLLVVAALGGSIWPRCICAVRSRRRPSSSSTRASPSPDSSRY